MNQPTGSMHVTSLTDTYFSKRKGKNHASSGMQRVYPWLLCISTAIAGIFCFAYITKPIVLTHTKEKTVTLTKTEPAVESKTITQTPSGTFTPPSGQVIPPAQLFTGFEETNIRMQHILDVTSSNGDVHRLVVDVPALYKSRNLRWTQENAAQARLLLKRLEQFQEKSRALRDEGQLLSKEWNALMDSSIPQTILRADSPSLSTNLQMEK